MCSTSLPIRTQQEREEFCNIILLFAVWCCHQTVMLLIKNRAFISHVIVLSEHCVQFTFISAYILLVAEGLSRHYCPFACLSLYCFLSAQHTEKLILLYSHLSQLSCSFMQRKYWTEKIMVMSFLSTDCDPLLQPTDQRHLFFEWGMC